MTQNVNKEIKRLQAALKQLDDYGRLRGRLKLFLLTHLNGYQDCKRWARVRNPLMLSIKSRLPAHQHMKALLM